MTLRSPLRGPARAAGAWTIAASALALAAGAARLLLAARLLGTQQVGLAAMALLALAAVEGLTATGAETALASHPGRAEDDLDAAFTLQAARGVLLAGLLWCLAAPVAWLFAAPALVPLVRALALVPLLRGVASPAQALLVRAIRFRRLFWGGVVESAVGLAVALVVAAARHDAWALVAAAVAGQAAATACSYLLAPYRPRLRTRGRGMRRLLYYGRWMGATRGLMFVSLYVDNLVVGRLLGPSTLGVYQVAFRAGELAVLGITRPAAQVALPLLSRLRRAPDRLRRRYRTLLRTVLAANLGFALAAALGGPALTWLLGPQWGPVAPLLAVLALAMALRSIVILSGELFYALGQPRLTLQVNLVRVGTLAVLIYPLVAALGVMGAALAVLSSSAAAAALAVRLTAAALRSPIGPLLQPAS